MRDVIKIFNTKYCLTSGILEQDAIEVGDGMVEIPKTGKTFAYWLHGEGKEWHRTLDSAILHAEDMKAKKISSLNKSISKLENLKFK